MSFSYVGSGTIYLGSVGGNQPSVTLNFPMTFSWDIDQSIAVIQLLTWNIGVLPNYWFRVIASCYLVQPQAPQNYTKGCNTQIMTMVLATTPQSVCQQLTNSNFIWQILSMGRFSTPANNDIAQTMAAAGLIDLNNNVLIPVQYCQCAECLPYCLGGNSVIEIGGDMTVDDIFFHYKGAGGISINGAVSVPNRPNWVSGSGGIHLGGFANRTCTQWNCQGSGGVHLGGSCNRTSTQWNYQGQGGIDLDGSALVITGQYTLRGGGSVGLGGGANSTMSLAFVSTGFSRIGPSFAGVQLHGSANALAQYDFITHGHGGIHIGGGAETYCSNFSTYGNGGIHIDGHARSIAPKQHAYGSGGIHLIGGGYTKLSSGTRGKGGVHLIGFAPAKLSLSYVGKGGIEMGGATRTNWFFGKGGIHLGGSAIIRSTWLGILVDCWGADIECQDLSPTFGVQPGAALVAPTNQINSCGVLGIPLVLELAHNLNSSYILSSFLFRNNLTMPNVFVLSYSYVTGTWRGGYHYRDTAESQEQWDIILEWGCLTNVYDANGVALWKSSFYIRRQNLQTGTDTETRIVVLLNAEPLATSFNNNGIDLTVDVAPRTGAVTVDATVATVESSVCFDGVGLFAQTIWATNPFQYTLSAIGQFRPIPLYDIFSIFPNPSEYDLSS